MAAPEKEERTREGREEAVRLFCLPTLRGRLLRVLSKKIPPPPSAQVPLVLLRYQVLYQTTNEYTNSQ